MREYSLLFSHSKNINDLPSLLSIECLLEDFFLSSFLSFFLPLKIKTMCVGEGGCMCVGVPDLVVSVHN